MWISVLAGLAISATAAPADRDAMLPTTTPPILYVINYSGDHFKKAGYIDQFRANPPDLLHVGKATPITHLWGPVRMYQGENQWTGGPGHTLNRDNIALLSQDALAERIVNIRRTLDHYHDIGIREILPYISYHTVSGDHEKRLGFWNFYDNWETYTRWAGPRPARDPLDWLVVDVHGKFVGGSCGGYSPDYYAPLHRYRACINHPDWAEWHRRLVRLIAEAGYDGCFVDNCHPDPCYCRHCKAAFRKFLDQNSDLAWVRRLTEGLDVDNLQLDSPDLPAELVRRARLLRTRDHLGMLREVGRQVRPDFTIFPNGNSTSQCLLTGAKCDRLMFESTYSPGIMATPETATIDQIAIEVTADAVEQKQFTHRYDVGDSSMWIEMEAEIAAPTRAAVGKPVQFDVKVLNVGGSQQDNDFAEDFHLLLRDAGGGAAVRVDLEPEVVLGAPGPSGKGRRPPATLTATWTPKRPGRYQPHIGCTYTDGGHIQLYKHLAKLDRGQMCRTHIGTLMFAQHMQARSIFLGYETRRSGWENVAELGMAEMAAFSGGGGFAAGGLVQAKYSDFFKKHAGLFDGWKPTAPAAVLFARWGSNPLAHVRPTQPLTVHDYLAGTQRLSIALIDEKLPDEASRLEGLRVIYLQAKEYEMTQEQLDSLVDYVQQGGWLVALDEQITINGCPVSQLLDITRNKPVREYGRGEMILWDWHSPTAPTRPVLVAEGIQRNLRFALYRKGTSLAFHAVNYNVCLLDKGKSVLDVDNAEIKFPLPEGWSAATATCFDPDAEPEETLCSVSDGFVRLSLPKIHIYKVVLLEEQ